MHPFCEGGVQITTRNQRDKKLHTSKQQNGEHPTLRVLQRDQVKAGAEVVMETAR